MAPHAQYRQERPVVDSLGLLKIPENLQKIHVGFSSLFSKTNFNEFWEITKKKLSLVMASKASISWIRFHQNSLSKYIFKLFILSVAIYQSLFAKEYKMVRPQP
jgi:hypothetical protein